MKDIDKYLSYVIYGALFLVPFLSIIITGQSFFPFITGKNFLFRILVEIGLAAYILRAFTNPKVRPEKSWILIAYTVFFLVISLATIFSIDSLRSFWSNFERMEGLIGHIHLFAYFLVLVGTLSTEKLWNKFLHTTLFASIVVGVYSVLQLFGYVRIFQSSERIEATFGNSTYLAVYLLFHIFIAAFLLFNKKERSLWQTLLTPFYYFKKREGFRLPDLFYWSIIVLESVILLFTETRGAIVGLLAGLVVIAVLQVVLNKGAARKYSLMALTGLVVVSSLFMVFKDSELLQENRITRRLSSISLNDSAVQARFTVWGMAYEGFKEKPILGWGMENFNIVFNKYYEPKLFNEEPWFDRAHNVFFDWLINAGILGLLAYLSLFASAVYYLLFRGSEHINLNGRIILVGLLAAYFAQNVFVFDNIMSYVMFFTILGFVHYSYKEKWDSETLKNVARKEFSEKVIYIVGPLLVVLLMGSLYYANIKPFSTSRDLIKGLTQFEQTRGIAYNQNLLEDVIDRGYLGKQEAAEQYLQLAFNVSQNNTIPQEDRIAFLESARTKMEEVIELRPLDARPKLFLGSFFIRFQDFDNALLYLREAQELSPEKQAIQIEIVNALISQRKFEEAFQVAEKMYALEERNEQAGLIYAAAAITNNKQDIAEEVLLKHFDTTIVPNERLANAYLVIGQTQKAIEILEKIKEQNPGAAEQIDQLIKQIR